MAKNCMAAVAKMLGVELGEKFIIENAEHNLQVVLGADGLHVTKDDFLGSSNSILLQKVLCGLFEVKKLPWEPKYKEYYYCPSITQRRVIEFLWIGDTHDYAMKALGMVYRTREEAEAHLAEDYERLTGKKLEVQNNE